MRNIGAYLGILVAISSLPLAHCEETENVLVSLEEDEDAPDFLWETVHIGSAWQKLNVSNATYLGGFSSNDSVDVFAIEITSENWTIVGFSVKPESNVTISIQRLDQSTWNIMSFSNETNGEIELDQGTHAVRVERLGSNGEDLEYRFTISNLGNVDLEGRFVNLAWKFTPFYIFSGILLISPLLVVLWWNRRELFSGKGKEDLLEEHEQFSLRSLRGRFEQELTEETSRKKIMSSLKVLAEKSWKSVTKEFGEPEIRHFTDDLDICAWRFDGSNRSILIGIKTSNQGWEMAAIRIYSPLGEDSKIDSIEPEMMFQDDEVFIGDLAKNTTTFLRIITIGSPSSVNMHVSGLVGGSPVAAAPAKSINYESE